MHLARAAFAAVILAASPAVLSAPCAGFNDVSDSDPFCVYVSWMKNRSITLGLTPTQYDPAGFVTRMQMAAFMYRLGYQNAFLQGGNVFGATAVLGTTDDQAIDIRANGRRVMRYEPGGISPNVIGGSPQNSVTAGARGATIAGGGAPIDMEPLYPFEAPNRVTDAYGTVGGGYANRAGNDTGTPTDAPFNTVAGGLVNVAGGDSAFVGGGYNNRALGSYATVAGGASNLSTGAFTSTVGGGDSNVAAGIASTIGGGLLNIAVADNSAISGGANNSTYGEHSMVGGGEFNSSTGDHAATGGGYGNQATGDAAFVGGGYSNVAGVQAAVGGGWDNTATGVYSAIAGGAFNFATGIASHAAGYRAEANADGCFVFGDYSTTNPISCNAANRFVVRALGGVFMFSGGSSQAAYTGVVLAPGGTSWVVGSDRALKEDVRTVDPGTVLARLVDMPITTWRLKAQDAGIRHMGPMAQDFRAAFDLGESELGINTVDADGVALAAIQGLNAKLEAEVATLRAELTELRSLRAEVAAIRAALPSTAVTANTRP